MPLIFSFAARLHSEGLKTSLGDTRGHEKLSHHATLHASMEKGYVVSVDYS